MNTNKQDRRILPVILIVILALALSMLPGSLAAADDDAVSDEVVVKVAPGHTVAGINATYGSTTLRPLLGSRAIYLLRLAPASDPDQVLEAMEADRRLVYAEPNLISDVFEANPHKSYSLSTPLWLGTEPQPYDYQYAASMLELSAAHRISSGAGTVVALLDSGVQSAHPQLRTRIAAGGYDFVEDDANPADVGNGFDDDADGAVDEAVGHGTHVAGIVRLVAPAAKIMPLRVLDSDGRGNAFLAAEAFLHAAEQGADVINASFGVSNESELMEDVVEDVTEDHGVVVVGAAGNAGSTAKQYPAAGEDVLAVGSVGPTGTRSVFTNHGPWVPVFAPGEKIVSTFPANGYAAWSGTSMAAPFVAGQAALLRGLDSRLTVEQMSARIVTTAKPLVGGPTGAAVIDIPASLNASDPEEDDNDGDADD